MTIQNRAYPDEKIDLGVDAELDAILNEPDMSTIRGLDTSFPGAAKTVLAFAIENVNSKVYPHLAQNITVGGKAQGRSLAGSGSEDNTIVDDTTEYFLRPNGDKYYHRPWGRTNDVQTIRTARESNLFPLLQGPPGTGKTALIEAAFNTPEDLYTIIGTGDTETADFLGSYIQDVNGAFVWVDGPLIRAMEAGAVFFIDEIGLVDPKVLSLVYGVMDGRDELVVTANPQRGTIKAAPGFFVIAATNPNAPGVRLSEALLSRFAIHVEITTDYLRAKKIGVEERMVQTAKHLDKRVRTGGDIEWAPQFRELLVFRDLSKAFGEDFALANLAMSAPESCREEVASILSANFGRPILPARVG